MKRAPSTVVTRVSSEAPARAPNAAWVPPPPKRGGDVAPLALLEQHDEYQQQARDYVDAGQDHAQHSHQ